jgi:Amidohydrolase
MPSWKLFSADDHVDLQYLPGDMWVKRVPQKYRDRVPRLIETTDGWHFEADGKLFGRHYKYDDFTSAKFGKSTSPVIQEPGRWRPTTPELRLEDMDRDGVECQVMYGGLIAGFQLEEPELNAVSMRAYNEWIAEFCGASPERLIGLGFVPVHDVDSAVQELYNCAKLGLKGVQFQAFDAKRRIWVGVGTAMECGGGNRNSYLLPPGRRPLERRWDRHTPGTRRRIGEDNSSGGPAGRSAGSSCTVRSAGEAP